MHPPVCAFRLVAVVCLLGLIPLTNTARPVRAQLAAEYVAGELLVKMKPGVQAGEATRIHRDNGAQPKQTIPAIGVVVLDIPPGSEQQKQQLYSANPNVLFAELNGIVSVAAEPNDPRSDEQWQYNNTGQTGGTVDADIDAFEAWNTTTGSSSVAIAVLDTGIDQNHEDLAGKITKNINLTDSSTADDIHGHGTHVAGTVAAATNNSRGVAGTCPGCTLYNVKVLNDGGGGTSEWVANGMIWAADNGARVINMSLGCQACISSTMEEAINYAWSKGVVVVAAAGNDGSNALFYPGSYTNSIAVASTDHNDAKSGFSNYGAWVDVAAPGDAILSTTNDGGYGLFWGTSMASPHVAGLAGLIWSTGRCADHVCVRRQIETKADPIAGTGTNWTYGRVNAAASVAVAGGNLIANPGMELDSNGDGRPDNWSFNGSIARSNAVVRSGSYAMRHRPSTNTTYTIYSDSIQPISGGKPYTFSAWVNIPSTSDTFSFSLVAGWKNASGTQLGTTTIKTYTAATSGWNNAHAVVTPPNGATQLTLRMVVNNLNATVYVDDFSFTPISNIVANPGMEIDGNGDGRPDNWTFNGSIARSNAVVRSGSYAMRHRPSTNTTYTIYSDSIQPISGGKPYTFSAWVNIPSTSDTFSFSLVASWKNASGTQLGTTTIKTYTAATSGWNEAKGVHVAPAGATQLTLRMVVNSLNATVYVDDVLVGQ